MGAVIYFPLRSLLQERQGVRSECESVRATDGEEGLQLPLLQRQHFLMKQRRRTDSSAESRGMDWRPASESKVWRQGFIGACGRCCSCSPFANLPDCVSSAQQLKRTSNLRVCTLLCYPLHTLIISVHGEKLTQDRTMTHRQMRLAFIFNLC